MAIFVLPSMLFANLKSNLLLSCKEIKIACVNIVLALIRSIQCLFFKCLFHLDSSMRRYRLRSRVYYDVLEREIIFLFITVAWMSNVYSSEF